MKACEVKATFTQDGTPRPQQITWEGEIYQILDIGRRWGADDGQHMLARVTDGRVFELAYNGIGWCAKVVSKPPSFA